MAVVGRVDGESARWYVDPADESSRYESVTTILSRAESLPWLVSWVAKLGAEYVAANLDELMEVYLGPQGPAGVISLVKAQTAIRRDLKADLGTYQHDVMEALVMDTRIPDVPEHLVDVEVDGERVDHDELSDGILHFVTDFDVQPLMAEATVASTLYGYAGTLDLIADLGRSPLPGRPRGLVDLKTGILKTHARAQLAAYRRSDEVWLPLGDKAPMPRVDWAAVLHVRKSYRRGYKLVPAFGVDPEQAAAREEAAFQWFLACQVVLRHQEAQEKVPRTAWYPPREDGTQPAPYLEDVEHAAFRCRKALMDGGIDSLDQLALFTGADLRAMKGVGPKAIEVCTELLAAHGLALLPDPPAPPKQRRGRKTTTTTTSTEEVSA